MRVTPRHLTTICTPTYWLGKKEPKVSSLLGWMLFGIFLMSLFFLFVGLVFMFSVPMVKWQRNIIVAAFVAAIFIVLVALFLVDSLRSIEEKLYELHESSSACEKHLYNLYLIQAKVLKGKEPPGTDK